MEGIPSSGETDRTNDRIPSTSDKPPVEIDIQKILKDVPEPQRREISRLIQMQVTQTRYSGPLPPPFIIEGYERVLPGSANRILKMAENQTEHRQALENKVISSNIVNEKIGLVLGFILALSFVVAGYFLVQNDKQVTGFAALGAPVAAIIAVYIERRRGQERELEEKKQKVLGASTKNNPSSTSPANAKKTTQGKQKGTRR